MDICYYNSQIKDELDGAAAYIKKAIKCKDAHPEWASLYAKMSGAELDHAKNLVAIFEDDYKTAIAAMPECKKVLEDVHKTITDMYAEHAAKIKYIIGMFEEK